MNFIFFILGTATLTFSNIRPILGLTISDVFYLASLVGSIFEILVLHKPIRKKDLLHPFILPSILILIGGFLSSYLRSGYINASIREILETIYVFSIFSFVVLYMVKNEKRTELVLNAIILGITFSSMIAAIDGTLGTSLGPIFSYNANSTLIYGAARRYAGVTAHPNFQGYYAAVCLPLIAEFIIKFKNTHIKLILYLLAFSVCGYSLLITGSIEQFGCGTSRIINFYFY